MILDNHKHDVAPSGEFFHLICSTLQLVSDKRLITRRNATGPATTYMHPLPDWTTLGVGSKHA